MTMNICPHGYGYSPATYRAHDGCMLPIPDDPRLAPITDEGFRAMEELTRELTDGYWTGHGLGELVEKQLPELNGVTFIYNTRNSKVLWEARLGSGPATEAMCLLPWVARMLLAEVKRLRKELTETVRTSDRATGLSAVRCSNCLAAVREDTHMVWPAGPSGPPTWTCTEYMESRASGPTTATRAHAPPCQNCLDPDPYREDSHMSWPDGPNHDRRCIPSRGPLASHVVVRPRAGHLASRVDGPYRRPAGPGAHHEDLGRKQQALDVASPQGRAGERKMTIWESSTTVSRTMASPCHIA